MIDTNPSRFKLKPYKSKVIEYLRVCARRWRTSSKARGCDVRTIPSIDDVHKYLIGAPPMCCYCGGSITKPVLDHKQPVVRGGTAALTNIGVSCGPCNGAKGPLNESEFRALIDLIRTWEDKGRSLLIRLRGGFWTYRI